MQSNAHFPYWQTKRRLGDRPPPDSPCTSTERSRAQESLPIPSFSVDRLPPQRLPITGSPESPSSSFSRSFSHSRRNDSVSARAASMSASMSALMSASVAYPQITHTRLHAIAAKAADGRKKFRRSPSRRLRRARALRTRSQRTRPKPSFRSWTAGLRAIAWVAIAMLLRWVLEAVMMVSSQFWLLGALLAIAPAVIAVWLTQTSPRMGLKIGYRCLLMMLGLLLGGKVGGL